MCLVFRNSVFLSSVLTEDLPFIAVYFHILGDWVL